MFYVCSILSITGDKYKEDIIISRSQYRQIVDRPDTHPFAISLNPYSEKEEELLLTNIPELITYYRLRHHYREYHYYQAKQYSSHLALQTESQEIINSYQYDFNILNTSISNRSTFSMRFQPYFVNFCDFHINVAPEELNRTLSSIDSAICRTWISEQISTEYTSHWPTIKRIYRFNNESSEHHRSILLLQYAEGKISIYRLCTSQGDEYLPPEHNDISKIFYDLIRNYVRGCFFEIPIIQLNRLISDEAVNQLKIFYNALAVPTPMPCQLAIHEWNKFKNIIQNDENSVVLQRYAPLILQQCLHYEKYDAFDFLMQYGFSQD